MEGLVCWKCGAKVIERLPLARQAQCACGAALYCCRLCVHYQPAWTRGCYEPRAEDPRTRDGANFCDWFRPKANAFTAQASKDQSARDALADLFKK